MDDCNLFFFAIFRFSLDVDMLDDQIPNYSKLFLFNMATIVNTVIVISYSLPILLAVVVPLAILFLIMQVYI